MQLNFRSLPKFQFSLAWLMIAVTCVALVLAVAHILGSVIGALLFATVCCVLPTPLVICAIFARGDLQAFAIGALVPWVTLFAWLPSQSFLSMALWLLILPIVCGVIGAFTRRWIRRHGDL